MIATTIRAMQRISFESSVIWSVLKGNRILRSDSGFLGKQAEGGLSEASPPNFVRECDAAGFAWARRCAPLPTLRSYCFRYPLFLNHSIKIFSTKEETVRKSSAAAFSSAALVSGWTLTPSEGVFPMAYLFLQ